MLSSEEVVRFLAAVSNFKHKVMLSIAYSAGLRISEVLRLRVSDIDSQRMIIRIQLSEAQYAKQLIEDLKHFYRFGEKDRLVNTIKSITTLKQLNNSVWSTCELNDKIYKR